MGVERRLSPGTSVVDNGQIEIGISEIYVPRCVRVLLGIRQCVEHQCLHKIVGLTWRPRTPGQHLPRRAVFSVCWHNEVLVDVPFISHALPL